MKKFTFPPVLVLFLLLSTTCYAEWKKVGKNSTATIYLDAEKIKREGEFVYFWQLQNLLKPNIFGDSSYKIYHEGDCKTFRFKTVSYTSHKEAMGEGGGKAYTPPINKWLSPSPKTPQGSLLTTVCQGGK